ncbi:MAG: hypothetical protein JO354_14110 [Verrucomicrobia bacterium]|nr:hypothetical protein [Verrucomicrobiota bacterium]
MTAVRTNDTQPPEAAKQRSFSLAERVSEWFNAGMPTRPADFAISSDPVPARTADLAEQSSQPELYSGPASLFAVARNPTTLFVCWNVNWAAVFAHALPVDRRAHVKLRSARGERTHPVEPLSGTCCIGDLEPGDTYEIELGFIPAPEQWQPITSAPAVELPRQTIAIDSAIVDVASVPFHLEFQELVELFDGNGRVAEALAELERRAAESDLSARVDQEPARVLKLSAETLQKITATREKLTRSQPRRLEREQWLGSSLHG